jgi:glutamyl-tRNA synthetase
MDIIVQEFLKIPDWKAQYIESHIREFMELQGRKINEMIFAIRVSLCGHNIGPSLFESMEILGKNECLERLYQGMSLIEK